MPLARALNCSPSCRSLHMYLLLKRKRGGGSSGEGRVGRRGGVRPDITVLCVCVRRHTEQLQSFISPHTGRIFSFLISLRERPRRRADLSGWCKWSVNENAATRMKLNSVKVSDCADLSLPLTANTKNKFLAHFFLVENGCDQKFCLNFTEQKEKEKKKPFLLPEGEWDQQASEKHTTSQWSNSQTAQKSVITLQRYPWQKNNLTVVSSTESKQEKVHKSSKL